MDMLIINLPHNGQFNGRKYSFEKKISVEI